MFTNQDVIDGIINIYIQFYDSTKDGDIKTKVKEFLSKSKISLSDLRHIEVNSLKKGRTQFQINTCYLKLVLGINKKNKKQEDSQNSESVEAVTSKQSKIQSNKKSSKEHNEIDEYSNSSEDNSVSEDEEAEEDDLQTFYSETNKKFSLIVQTQPKKFSNKKNDQSQNEKIEEKIRSQSFEDKSPTSKGKNKSVFFAQDDSATSSPRGNTNKNSPTMGTFEDFKSAAFSLKLLKTPSNRAEQLDSKAQSSPSLIKLKKQKIYPMNPQRIEEWILNNNGKDLLIQQNEQAKVTFKNRQNLNLIILFIVKPKDMPINKELLRKEEMKGVITETAVGFRRNLTEMFGGRPWEINSYIFRSFKSMELLLMYENFEFLLRFNNVIEIFFDELNKVLLNNNSCNYNHVANCIEFFLKYVPEMTLIEMTKYNILYSLIGFFDYPQVQRLFYLLFNINYKNDYPVQEHLLKKFWEYSQATYLFRELITMMLYCDLKKLRKMFKEDFLKTQPTCDIITYFTSQRQKLKDFENEKVFNKSVAEEGFGFGVDIDKIKTQIVKSRMNALKGAFTRGQIQNQKDEVSQQQNKVTQATEQKRSISEKRNSILRQQTPRKSIQKNNISDSSIDQGSNKHLIMIKKGNKNVKKIIQENNSQMKFSDVVKIAQQNKEKIAINDQIQKIQNSINSNSQNDLSIRNKQKLLSIVSNQSPSKKNTSLNKSQFTIKRGNSTNVSTFQEKQRESDNRQSTKINESFNSNSKQSTVVTKRRSISERNLRTYRNKTEINESSRFLPEIALNQSFYTNMEKQQDVSTTIKKLSQKELTLLKSVRIVNSSGVNRVMPQLFNVKLLNKQESYLSDLQKLDQLYPAQNDFFYNQSQNDILAEQNHFSLDQLIKNDSYSHTIAQFIFNLLRNIIQEPSEQEIFKLLHLKTYDYENLLECIIFSDQQYNLFEYIMKNYIFKLKIHTINPENSAFVCGKMVNWFLTNKEHKMLSKYKEQICLAAKRHLKILCKLIINSYGWKLKKSDSYLKFQKFQQIEDPVGCARVLLLETLYLIIKGETEHKVDMLEFIPDTCWNALFNLFFEDKNNTVYQSKFYEFYTECLPHFKFNTFFSIWIKLNFLQNLLNIHESPHLYDSLKIYHKKFILSIIQLIEDKPQEMRSLSQVLNGSETWKIISKPYIQKQLSSVPSLSELDLAKQISLKKSSRSLSKFKDEQDLGNTKKQNDSPDIRTDREKLVIKKQKKSDQSVSENKISQAQQNLMDRHSIEKKQLIQSQNIRLQNKGIPEEPNNVVKKLDEKANKIIQMAWQNTVFFNQVMAKKKNQIDLEEMPFLKK